MRKHSHEIPSPAPSRSSRVPHPFFYYTLSISKNHCFHLLFYLYFLLLSFSVNSFIL